VEHCFLVADEGVLCREGLVALLQRIRRNVRAEQASSLAGVIEILSGDPTVEIAIVDLGLSGLGGIDGVRHLRTHFPQVRIVVTAIALRRDLIVDCLRAGVHGYISKSMPVEEILEALETIDNKRIFVPSVMSEEGGEVGFREPPRPLSERQREVLAALATGKSNKEIAWQLRISEGTVKVHVHALFRALGVHNRVGAVAAFMDIESSPTTFEPPLPGLLQANRQVGHRRV
jgi:DNA-binding NarL/FixJ family response regulator